MRSITMTDEQTAAYDNDDMSTIRDLQDQALRSHEWSDEDIVDYIERFYDERIEALRWEAGSAGDLELARLCDVALNEDAPMSERADAALECLRVIEDGEAAH